jgi:hypothetical protein
MLVLFHTQAEITTPVKLKLPDKSLISASNLGNLNHATPEFTS